VTLGSGVGTRCTNYREGTGCPARELHTNNAPLFGLSRCGNAQGLVPGERQGSLMNSSSINLESPLMTTITPTR
jgi:hypothetical protein